MSINAPLARQVTVHNGQFWFRDEENVYYALEPDMAREIVNHIHLLSFATIPAYRYVTLGCMRVKRSVHATVELSLMVSERGMQMIQVSEEWLYVITPLLERALSSFQESPDNSFTLIHDERNLIIHMTADRKSLPPRARVS